jgi:hypothetical protein
LEGIELDQCCARWALQLSLSLKERAQCASQLSLWFSRWPCSSVLVVKAHRDFKARKAIKGPPALRALQVLPALRALQVLPDPPALQVLPDLPGQRVMQVLPDLPGQRVMSVLLALRGRREIPGRRVHLACESFGRTAPLPPAQSSAAKMKCSLRPTAAPAEAPRCSQRKEVLRVVHPIRR